MSVILTAVPFSSFLIRESMLERIWAHMTRSLCSCMWACSTRSTTGNRMHRESTAQTHQRLNEVEITEREQLRKFSTLISPRGHNVLLCFHAQLKHYWLELMKLLYDIHMICMRDVFSLLHAAFGSVLQIKNWHSNSLQCKPFIKNSLITWNLAHCRVTIS